MHLLLVVSVGCIIVFCEKSSYQNGFFLVSESLEIVRTGRIGFTNLFSIAKNVLQVN